MKTLALHGKRCRAGIFRTGREIGRRDLAERAVFLAAAEFAQETV